MTDGLVDASPEEDSGEALRRTLRTNIRGTIKDMATAVQNMTGATEEAAFAYIVEEAKWVQEYYDQRRTPAGAQALLAEGGHTVEAREPLAGAVVGATVLEGSESHVVQQEEGAS